MLLGRWRYSASIYTMFYWASPVAQWLRIHQCRRPGCDPWVRKLPWRREWLPTPVFLLGKPHRQRGAWWATVHGVAKESDVTEWLTNTMYACLGHGGCAKNVYWMALYYMHVFNHHGFSWFHKNSKNSKNSCFVSLTEPSTRSQSPDNSLQLSGATQNCLKSLGS